MSTATNTQTKPPTSPSPLLLDTILTWTAVFSGAIGLALLMGLIVVDVFLRYVFNSPIFGAQDISTLALIIIVSGAIPYAARTGMHVVVEVLDPYIGLQGRRITDILSRVIGCSVISGLTFQLIHGASEAKEFAETTPLLELSFSSFYIALAIGFGFYALILAVEAIILLFHPELPKLSPDSKPKEQI